MYEGYAVGSTRGRRVPSYTAYVLMCLLAMLPFPIAVAARAGTDPWGDAGCSRLAAAALIAGSWDIVILDPSKGRYIDVIASPDDERAPAWSPDGKAIAFEARYDHNSDIYTVDLASGMLQRLTDSPAYDGSPSWSPDGAQIAFESYRDGNLEVYVMPARGGPPVRVTDDPAADSEPAWKAEGQHLVITSWRSGARRHYEVDAVSTHVSPLPPWHGVYEPRRLVLEPIVQPHAVYPGAWRLSLQQHRLSGAVPQANPRGMVELPGRWEQLVCAPYATPSLNSRWQPLSAINPKRRDHRPGLAPLNDVRALQPRLAADVVDSFQALRGHVQHASGYDLLASLNDAWRGIDHPEGQYISWHKAGRAIDIRDWFAPDGEQHLIIAREDLAGERFFRIYLRAARQDGSQGRPLRESVWSTEGRLVHPALSRSGGQAVSPPEGYFVDFTDLAEKLGWTRIPALTPPHGDWRRTYIDLEFWHYERRDGLRWYEAMELLYSMDVLRERFSKDRLLGLGYTSAALARTGIPDVGATHRHQLIRHIGCPC